MKISEDFERCEKCGEGWFYIEEQVLVSKNSEKDSPAYEKKRYVHRCTVCTHIQYMSHRGGD